VWFPITRKVLAIGLRGYVRVVGGLFGLPAAAVPVLTATIDRLDPPDRSNALPFLSEEWFAAASRIRESFRGRESIKPPPVRVNHIVTEVPFGPGIVHAHTDSTSGGLEFEPKLLDDPDLTVTMPYAVARSLLLDADAAAAMQAIAGGRVKIEGDFSKLMALNTAAVDPLALEAATRVRAITAPG
jgi:hypothetical protein